MRFVQCLSSLSVDRLRRIVDTCRVPTTSLSKQHLISAINSRFQRPRFLRGVWEGLPHVQQVVLAFLVRQRITAFDWDDLVRHVSRGVLAGNDQEAYDVLEALCDTGLVARLSEQNGSRIVIAEDLVEPLSELLAERAEAAGVRPMAAPATVHSGKPSLQRNLFHLVALAAKEALRLTKQDQLFRRTRERAEELLLPMQIRDFVRHPETIAQYPCGTDLLIRLGVQDRLLRLRDGNLEVGPAVEGFIQLDENTATHGIHAGFEEAFVSPDMQLALLRSVLAETLAAGEWFDVEAVVAQVLAYERLPEALVTSARAKIQWYLETQWAMGLLDIGEGESGWLVRLTPLGRHLLTGAPAPTPADPGPITLLPDFRIIVPVTVPLADLWRIERFADLVTCDVVLTYTISKYSIYRALVSGMSTDEILAHLERWTGKPPSQNVRYTIAGWGESYGRIEFRDVLLLRCDSEDLARELRAVPEVARYVRGEITPRDLIVDREHYDQLVQTLEQLDYLPKPLHDAVPPD